MGGSHEPGVGARL